MPLAWLRSVSHAAPLLGLLLAASAPAAAGPLVSAGGPLLWLEAHFHVSLSLDGLQSADDVVVSPDGAHVYVAGRGDDAVSWWSRDAASGRLAYGGRALWTGQPGGTVPDLVHPFALAVAPDGAHLYATAIDSSAIVVFARDAASGALSYVASYADAAGADPAQPLTLLKYPRAVAVSPDGAQVYTGSFDDTVPPDEEAVIVFSRDPATGLLTPLEAQVPQPGGIDVLLRIRDLAVSPDGANVYAASVGSAVILGQPASVVVFTRAAATGRLSFLESQKEGVAGVSGIENCRDVAVSPDGKNVYAAGGGATDPGLATFARDPATGALTWLDARPIAEIGAAQPNGLAITPDGAWLLLVAQGSSGSFDSRLVVYARDPDTGLLTLADAFADDAGGVDGLRGAFQVAVSPDGASAYVASEQDAPPGMPPSGGDHGGALAVFRVPEPAAGPAAAALGLAALAARRRRAQRGAASQSRGRRKTS